MLAVKKCLFLAHTGGRCLGFTDYCGMTGGRNTEKHRKASESQICSYDFFFFSKKDLCADMS